MIYANSFTMTVNYRLPKHELRNLTSLRQCESATVQDPIITKPSQTAKCAYHYAFNRNIRHLRPTVAYLWTYGENLGMSENKCRRTLDDAKLLSLVAAMGLRPWVVCNNVFLGCRLQSICWRVDSTTHGRKGVPNIKPLCCYSTTGCEVSELGWWCSIMMTHSSIEGHIDAAECDESMTVPNRIDSTTTIIWGWRDRTQILPLQPAGNFWGTMDVSDRYLICALQCVTPDWDRSTMNADPCYKRKPIDYMSAKISSYLGNDPLSLASSQCAGAELQFRRPG